MKRERYCDPCFLVVSFVFWYFSIAYLAWTARFRSQHVIEVRTLIWTQWYSICNSLRLGVNRYLLLYFGYFLGFWLIQPQLFHSHTIHWAPSKLQVEKTKLPRFFRVCKSFWCWQLQWVCWIGRADLRSRPGLCTQDVLSKPNLGSSHLHFNGSSSQDRQAFVIAADSSDSMPSLRFLCMGRATHPLLNCGPACIRDRAAVMF